MTHLRPFQTAFIKAATAPGCHTAIFSAPRSAGKSWLAGRLVARALTPGDPLFVAGGESVLVSGSIEQCRVVFRFVREVLDATTIAGEYSYIDSSTRVGITHKPTRTRLRVLGSAAKRAMGFVGVPLVIADEPGVYDVAAGELMHDAIRTARGKPGSPLRAIYTGTIAPSVSGWWADLVNRGSHRGTFVMHYRGEAETWDSWNTIRKANPLAMVSSELRATLLEERDEARRDSRLKAAFLSYRLNLPSADESTMCLTTDDWERVCARPVPERAGKPIVAYDLGHSRAWSACVAMYRSGRTEALALAPGIPNLDEQEKRDRVPRGTYRVLAENGSLRVADGLRVPTPAMLHAAAQEVFGAADRIICDRFKLPELRDAVRGSCKLVDRVTRWSDATSDIGALRKMAKDGPLSCAQSSRSLLTASLGAALVRNDDQGSVRMVKRSSHNTARDDVAAALVLASGALQRSLAFTGRRGGMVYHGMAQ